MVNQELDTATARDNHVFTNGICFNIIYTDSTYTVMIIAK